MIIVTKSTAAITKQIATLQADVYTRRLEEEQWIMSLISYNSYTAASALPDIYTCA